MSEEAGQISLTYCREGHRIRLEVREKTTQQVQTIQCPVCKEKFVVVFGYLLAVLPDEPELG